MHINKFQKITRFLRKNIMLVLFQLPRIIKYKFISDIRSLKGIPIRNQPVALMGKGSIVIGNKVNIGVYNSPTFFSTYAYIDARTEDSVIEIGNDVWINNNACIISEGS